jgi:pyruvoyl-dependent arginine decarboxylase (PvlArgDC)
VNKRPGHVVVTTEVGFCSFCGRPRNLRNEQHQLGALVRTIVTCETCHRTLSSSVGVATEEQAAPEPVAAETEAVAEAPAAPPPAKTVAKRKPASTTTKSTASKSTSKSAAKKKSG